MPRFRAPLNAGPVLAYVARVPSVPMKGLLKALVPVLLLLASAEVAVAQGLGDPQKYGYTRTSAFTYYGAADGAKEGLLESETVEPDIAQQCVTTTYTYDAYGNKTGATTANCAGATGRAVFASRTDTSEYAAVASQVITFNGSPLPGIPVRAGLFPTTRTNALGQSETRTTDPRFGAALTLTGPNALTTEWVLDDFGRKVLEIRADSTRTVIYHCVVGTGMDTTANTPGCPTPAVGEKPADAVMFQHSELQSATGTQLAPFVRTYTDAQGRTIRSVTQSFDGSLQPAARSGVLLVKDSVYNAYGAKVFETQPYFLVSGSSTTAGSNDQGVTRTDYDVLGRPTAVYTVDTHGSQPSVDFGAYGVRRAARQTLAYAALKTTLTNDQAQTRIEEKNAIGELVRATDASGAQLVHQRDAFGNLVATKDALQNAITLSFDVRGRKTSMADPDTGTWNYDYDALGQLVWQQSAVQLAGATQTTLAYDKLGRLIQRVEPEYTSTWSYDRYADASACNKGVGRLCESSTSAGVNRKLYYDNVGRPINVRTDFPSGPSMASVVAYDSASGRVTSQTYPTGLQVGYTYTTRGQLDKLTLKTAATVTPLPDSQGQTAAIGNLIADSTLWQARVVNAWGRTEQQGFGNGVIGRATFDAASGRTTDLSAGLGSATTVLDQHYAWDSLDNLTSRIDDNGDGTSGPVTENFSYADGLNRLTAYAVATPGVPGLNRNVTLQYNALGMLLYKSDAGNYAYPAQGPTSLRPHALQSVSSPASTSYAYDANGNLLTASGGKYRTIAYTSFNLPDSQTGAQGPSGTPKYTWLYDESHARIKEVHVDAGGTRTTWTQHPDNQGGLAFESETAPSGALSQRHYLSAAGQTIGVLVSTNPLPALATGQTAPPAPAVPIPLVKVEYWHKDQLGSLISTTDHTGAVTARYAYDPFGKRRLANGTGDAAGALVIDWKPTLNWGTDRGFTGHEQLDDIGLVHMNGRIYDAALGRFLQADPNLQDPANLQNFNRYAYCYNNPLTCTDPSGNSALSKLWHKIWHNPVLKIVIVVSVASITGGFALEAYATSMAATSGYASAAAAEAAAAAAGADTALVASVGGVGGAYTSAYVAAATSITGGAIQGAAAGFAGAFVGSGGNVKAGVQGAATGAVLGGVAMAVSDFDPVVRVGGKAATSALLAHAQGGSTLKAFQAQLITGSSSELYQAVVGWDAIASPGANSDCSPGACVSAEESNMYRPLDTAPGRIPVSWKYRNVVFLNEAMDGSGWDVIRQSGSLSRLANSIYGINATAQFHDSLFLGASSVNFNLLSNIATMIPAAAISYSALFDLIPTDRYRCPKCLP